MLLTGGTFTVEDETGTRSVVQGVSWIPGQDYLLTFRRQVGTEDHDGDGSTDDYEFYVRIERLSTGVAVTDLVRKGTDPTTNGAWWMSLSNYHFTQTMGPIIAFEGNDSTHEANAEAWLRNVYSGSPVNETTTTSNVTADNYQFFSKDRKIIPCRLNSNTLHSLDLQFVNPAGSVVKPLSGILEVVIKS